VPPLPVVLGPLVGTIFPSAAALNAAVSKWTAAFQAPLPSTATAAAAADYSQFGISFQNDRMAVRLGAAVTLVGVGVKASPFPAPTFTVWARLQVVLESQSQPLHFLVQGAGSAAGGGTLTLAGALTVADPGWVNPFGIRGLSVTNVALQVGFSATTIVDSLALSFQGTLGSSLQISFAGSVSVSNAGRSFLRGAISSAAPFGLRDLLLAANAMSSGLIPVPGWLPSASVFSLTAASFSIATAAGTDANGVAYAQGFGFSAKASLFGVQFAVTAALQQTPVAALGGVAMPDLQLSLSADFAALNAAAGAWLKTINSKADVPAWLSRGRYGICWLF
jgi:hypothetical protein